MKRLLLFVLLVLGFAASAANAQTKKVLLEEFTGSWCGWCPRGIWAIQQLEEQYPGKFIVASFHNGDPMITPAGDSIEAGRLLSAITGYPDGWLERRVYGSKLSIDPNNWPDEVDALVNEASVADVTVTNVTFDPTTRIVSGTVNAKFNMDTTGDFRINMYITENDVSGPAGTTWDQHNYLTGNPSYSDNPFFDLPAVVPNYKHQHVVRAVLGSIAGVAGVIPATAVKGMTYSQTFTYTLPNDIKADDAHLIGLAFRYKKASSGANLKLNEILNVDEVKVTNLKGLAVPATSSKNYITATRSGETTQEITLTNTSNAAAKVNLAIDENNTALPTGWEASISPTSVDIPAGQTATATLKYTAPANAGYASVTVLAMPVADGFTGHQSMLVVNALSAGTKYVSYGSDGFMEKHMGGAYTADYAVLPLDAGAMEAYPASQFDVGIFPNVNFFDYENLNGAPPAVVPTINALLNAGKKAFITSTFGLYYCFDAQAPYFQYMNTDAVQSLMGDKLGIE
ncbi:MAG TPA: Omp28-related outer membrane protein, partial [Candidatus Kapabacteria bacterium]|nr:Omp28-related outer membrane protein [Candidatus Kapabacteria bacterium]